MCLRHSQCKERRPRVILLIPMQQGDEEWSSDEESTVDGCNDSERWMHPGLPAVHFVERFPPVFARA